jgi:hypothetical protein
MKGAVATKAISFGIYGYWMDDIPSINAELPGKQHTERQQE